MRRTVALRKPIVKSYPFISSDSITAMGYQLAQGFRSTTVSNVSNERPITGEAWWPDLDHPEAIISVAFEWLDGRLEPTSLKISALTDVGPITASLVRRIPISRAIDQARQDAIKFLETKLRVWLPDLDPEDIEGSIRTAEESPETLGLTADGWGQLVLRASELYSAQRAEQTSHGRPRKYGPEHWAEVAHRYRTAYMAGSRSPTLDVAKAMGYSKSTAAKWVFRCRQMGLLPPTERGKPRAMSGEEGD